MACLAQPSTVPQPLNFAPPAAAALCGRSGGVTRRAAAPVASSGWAAWSKRLGSWLRLRPAIRSLAPRATSASGGSGSGEAAGQKKATPLPSPVPDADAKQLLHSLGLDGTVDPAAVPKCLLKLPVVQRMLENAPAVAAHLLSPAVGLTAQQVAQLLDGCPELFTWPPEQRAAPRFDELMAAGVTPAAAAQCFIAFPEAAECYSFTNSLAEVAAILTHSQDEDSSLCGPVAQAPAAQRSVAALLTQKPAAVALCQPGSLQMLAEQLQQVGLTAADVAALAWNWPEALAVFLFDDQGKFWLMHRFSAGMRPDRLMALGPRAAVLQRQLGFTPDQAVRVLVYWHPTLLDLPVAALEARAAALAEGFGGHVTVTMLLRKQSALSCEPDVWRRCLHYIAACGVADPQAVLRQCPDVLSFSHGSEAFLQFRLLLERATGLSAAQLYEQHPRLLFCRYKPAQLARWLQLAERRGLSTQQCMYVIDDGRYMELCAAVGASEAEWEAWAAYPPEACPLYRWAKQAAEKEAAWLAAALPPELAESGSATEQ